MANYLDIGPLQQGSIDVGPLQHQFVVTSTQSITAKARIQVSSTQTITAKGRIAGLVDQTITAEARISNTSSQSITAKSRITNTSTKTITALARLELISSQTITAKANIASDTNQTISAIASILKTTTQTLTAKSRIAVTDTKTITAKGNILGETTKDITALASIVPPISLCVDFETFTIGQVNPPVGSGISYQGTSIVTSGGPDLSTRYLQLSNSTITFTPGFAVSELTFTFSFLIGSGHGYPNGAPFLIFRDTNGTTSHDIAELRILESGNLAVRFPFAGTYPGISVDGLHQNKWYFGQVNIRSGAELGELYLAFSFYLDGETVIDFPLTDAGISIGSLFNISFNKVIFSPSGVSIGLGLDNLCLEPYDPSIIYPFPGTPNVKVAQAEIEVIELPETTNLRVGQGFIEIPELPTTSNLRVAQGFIELLIIETPPTPQPPPPIPTPFLGRSGCTVQVRPDRLDTVPDPPIEGIPNPPTPFGPPTRTCFA